MAFKMDGEWWDLPDATRHFQHYSPEGRASLAASQRAGHRQKGAVGEYFWTHPLRPGVAFPTRKAARIAAILSLAHTEATP